MTQRINFPSSQMTSSMRDYSMTAAAMHAQRMEPILPAILTVAETSGIEPAVLCAIISRESGAGKYLRDGKGDHGHGHGLMQIDIRYHAVWIAGSKWRDPETNIRKGAEILVGKIREVGVLAKQRAIEITDEQILRAGVAGYNASTDRVLNCLAADGDPDAATTGRDYSADVLCRAEWYREWMAKRVTKIALPPAVVPA